LLPEEGSGSILLVEDDGDVRRLLGDQLTRLGYKVKGVSSGEECLRALGSTAESTDLVLLDRYLPDGDGYEVLCKIRSGAEAPKPPVVIISVDRNAEGVAAALSAGAVDYLVKPFDSRVLAARVSAAIREARGKETLLKTQQVLARVKRELELIFDAVEEAILLVNPDLTVRRANRAAVRLAGRVSYDQLLGRSCHQVMCGRPDPCPECPVAEVLTSRGDCQREAQAEFGGRRGRFLRRAYYLGQGDAGDGMVVVVIEDVTRKRDAEREHLRAEKLEAVVRLAGGLAHEISQPLAAVSGRAELLEMALQGGAGGGGPEIARHVANLMANSRRLTEIVHRLQNVSDYVTRPYCGQTEILDLERSCRGREGAPAGEAPPDGEDRA
jgi:DNA-binding response OmpR family regulator